MQKAISMRVEMAFCIKILRGVLLFERNGKHCGEHFFVAANIFLRSKRRRGFEPRRRWVREKTTPFEFNP
jgi:hypothetical protein